jgi:hypothetical protein
MTGVDEEGQGGGQPKSALETSTMRAAFDMRVNLEVTALEAIEGVFKKALMLIPQLPPISGGEIDEHQRRAQDEFKELNDLYQELRLQCIFGGVVPSDPSTFESIAESSIKNRFDELRLLQARGNLTTEETIAYAEGVARRAAHINASTSHWISIMDTHREQIFRSV